MTGTEKQELTNTIEYNADMINLKVRQGKMELTEQVSELLDLVKDAKENGTSTMEAKLLLEDLVLALA